jgi:hypothetical protein
MMDFAIELRDLCTLVDWKIVAAMASDETVTVRTNGTVIYKHTDPQGTNHEILVGQLTPDQYTKVAIPE